MVFFSFLFLAAYECWTELNISRNIKRLIKNGGSWVKEEEIFILEIYEVSKASVFVFEEDDFCG